MVLNHIFHFCYYSQPCLAWEQKADGDERACLSVRNKKVNMFSIGVVIGISTHRGSSPLHAEIWRHMLLNLGLPPEWFLFIDQQTFPIANPCSTVKETSQHISNAVWTRSKRCDDVGLLHHSNIRSNIFSRC